MELRWQIAETVGVVRAKAKAPRALAQTLPQCPDQLCLSFLQPAPV